MLDSEPVLAFRYAASYLARRDAISLFQPELPLTDQVFDPRRPAGRGRDPLPLAGCLRDAAPDAWGRRVINLRRAGNPDADFGEMTYLLSSGSNRIGGLDFQASPTKYVTRDEDATLEQLLQLTDLVEAGLPVPPTLEAAAQHGTSIGGARPKALLTDGNRHLVAKFSSTTDTRPVVKAEAVAMLLAARAGLNVAPVEVRRVDGRDVLLVERFDRVATLPVPTRRLMLSMLTVLGYTAMSSRHASYAEIAQAVRSGPWTDVTGTLLEVYKRLVLNVIVGNNDDHLRNHAAFWDGQHLTLTPAYDIAPQPRSSQTSTQAIGITRDGTRWSQLATCHQVAPDFLLTPAQAKDITEEIVELVHRDWIEVADQAQLTTPERDDLWHREILNPFIHQT
ncbi:type II toxin-antitoxin system HipA family toxin [Nocardioides scoriae]|nr:HipA domain-containing protein [Nocardioides scoriae]